MSQPNDFMIDSYFDNCVEYRDRRKVVVVVDLKKKAAEQKEKPEYRIENKSQNLVVKITVDGGLFLTNTKPQKCDYLVLVQFKTNEKVAYFVELKGKDLKTAIEQIQETLKNIHKKLPDFSFRCRISQSKMQPIVATNQQKEKCIRYLCDHYDSNVSNIKPSELVKIGKTPLIETI
jgi:hydroxymethylpyrimidine pyrophosphatase-like HAD family hydrolase